MFVGKALVVLAVAAVCVAAMEVEVEADKPRLRKPRIVGAVPGRGTQHLKVVVVGKGDPRAYGGANPFLPVTPANAVPGQMPSMPILRASAPMTEITVQQLLGCMPGLSSSKANTVLPFMNAAMKEANVNNCARTAAFLAQLGHESGSLVYMEELASGAAYEGRRDLGNTQPGDGKRFKGRGPIQLTGRANYQKAGQALGMDLISNPTIVATNAVGFRTSAWFWSSHGLNELADQGAFSTITSRINGGQNGASDRNMRWGKCKIALACSGSTTPSDPFPGCTAKKGRCQTAPCNGVVVRNLCGAGAATCCTPKPTLQAGAPATGINPAFQPCVDIKGTCQTTPCTGVQVRNKCGPGAPVCCVPPGSLGPAPTIGSMGVDISQPLSANTAKCLASNRYTWISIRAGRSNGRVDTNAPASIRQAVAAGFGPSAISVYIFPFSDTADAASGGRQVTAMWQSLASVKDSFSTIWIDIEAAKWRTTGQNRLFFESMVAACRATGKQCGVYTSKVFWTQIMGASYTGGSSLPLWYPHYQSPSQQAMTDFSAFGGWTQPWAKQYKETTTVCGIGADLNVMNASFRAPLRSSAPTRVLKAGAPKRPAGKKAPAKKAPSKAPSKAPAAAAGSTTGSSITADQLRRCMPGLSAAKAATVLPFINAAQAQAQINTCKRKTAWLAQLGHESGSLVYMQEIASGAAYEGRRDLGNTQPGDGKRFKGRGPIQLTGRANYQKAGQALGLNLIANPQSVATNSVGFRTSAWFWSSHGLNALADQGAFSTITRRINGGTNGAADRNQRYATCRRVLGC